MLYKLVSSNEKYDTLEPVEFKDFSIFGHREKDLENLIANNILDVLFEDSGLMPIFQERQRQAESDIYALNEKGELVIFELKLGSAGEDAVHQVLRYAQDAGQWSYEKLQGKYQKYIRGESELVEKHKETFNLEHALEEKEINNKQHLFIVGRAADDDLIKAVDYWKRQGISIKFLPYRVYEIEQEKYFEFFALPYDKHRNPGDTKGVIFDTNRSYDEESIWYMMENSCVAAFGDAKRFVEYVYHDDIVFFSHKWEGIVAAARVNLGNSKAHDEHTQYKDVTFITPVPKKGDKLKSMPFRKVSEITEKKFYWARTIKSPYLSKGEAENLVLELKLYLKNSSE